jgi:hypothetical protein
MTMSKVHVPLDALTLSCTPDEIAAVFDGILREVRAAVPFLTDEDRSALRYIMGHRSGELTVADLFPDFARESAAHVSLRRLRTAQFIRPGGRDVWEPGSPIDIKPFARLAWDRLGEAAVFGEAQENEETEAAVPDGTAAEEEVDLALPDVNEPGEEEEPQEEEEREPVGVGSKEHRAAGWNDDDVLDFLNDKKSTRE